MPGIAAPRPAVGLASGSERLLAFIERSHGRACAILLLLGLACFLPGFTTLQPMDRDEPRFAQASKQMLETGDLVDIRFQGEPRYKKPIGIHWLQVGTVRAAEALGISEARTTIWLYRLPSLAGALAATLLAYWAALAFLPRRAAFLAAALVGASVILTVEARLAKTDAVLLACTTAAFGAFARVWLARTLPRQPFPMLAVFWIAVAAGVLIKGPMIVMFVGLAAAVLSWRERSTRWLRGLRPGWGLLFVLLCVLPWFGAIAWRSGGEFYRLAVGDDMLGKVQTGQQNHFAPPGFYLVAFFATFWPGAALAAIAAPFAWRERREDWVAFLLAWTVPAWVVFEAVPTKLPHYVMPLYPAIAILTVAAMARGVVEPRRRFARAWYALLPFIPVCLSAGIVSGTWLLDGRPPLVALPVMAAASAVAVAAWLMFTRGEVTRSALTGIAASVLLSVGVLGLAQLTLPALKLSPRLAAAIRALPCPDPVIGTIGYREPSLVFLTGTDLQMFATPPEAASFLRAGGCRALIVDRRFEPGLASAFGGELPAPTARVGGFNINGGRRVDLGVYASTP